MTTTMAKLLVNKEELLKRLEQDDLGPNERAEIEKILMKINIALNLLDDAGPGKL
jgi:hypothetical protein